MTFGADLRSVMETMVEGISLDLVDSKVSRLADPIVSNAMIPIETCSTVFPVCLNGTKRAPSSGTLYRCGKSARIDLRPWVSESDFEALANIHAAQRIASEPAVCVSLDSVREQAGTYLVSLIIVDKSPITGVRMVTKQVEVIIVSYA